MYKYLVINDTVQKFEVKIEKIEINNPLTKSIEFIDNEILVPYPNGSINIQKTDGASTALGLNIEDLKKIIIEMEKLQIIEKDGINFYHEVGE